QVFSADGKFLNAFPRESGSLKAPTAITVDRDGRVYVFDKQDHRVKVCDASGQILLTFGGEGTEPGKLKYAMGLAVSGKGDIYVSDSGNSRIQVFDSQGRFLREIQGKTQALSNPRGIALDEQGNLYVADSLISDVVTIDKQGSDFSFKNFQGLDGFYFPDGLAYWNHRLFVVDKGNKRVVVFQMPK
ncbi:MAG: 6-bladed beta-propeller, partial [Firmicutes bacterium]|nr:6-bladed beta-propeller [Bacillota bacterium]